MSLNLKTYLRLFEALHGRNASVWCIFWMRKGVVFELKCDIKLLFNCYDLWFSICVTSGLIWSPDFPPCRCLSICMIYNSAVFMRYSRPLGAARLAVTQCTIHMSVRPWCIYFPRLRALQSRGGCDVTASYQQQSEGCWIGWFISSLERDSCHVCCTPSLMSFILRLSLRHDSD